MRTGTENHQESKGFHNTESNWSHNTAIVLASGRGSRMHSDVPKQYLDLCGKPVLAWSLQVFQDFPGVDSIILVTSEEDIPYCRDEIIDKYRFDKVKRIVPGGAESTIAVHIRHLREKIEIDPADPRYLRVKWGKGYWISAKKRSAP